MIRRKIFNKILEWMEYPEGAELTRFQKFIGFLLWGPSSCGVERCGIIVYDFNRQIIKVGEMEYSIRLLEMGFSPGTYKITICQDGKKYYIEKWERVSSCTHA